MRKHRLARIIQFALLGLVFVAIAGLVIMSLWNWLMPALFGWHAVSYWQALGILVLSKILFGGFRGGRGWGRSRYWRRRVIERWEQMTPEEREKFRAGFRGSCGPFSPPDSAPKAPAG